MNQIIERLLNWLDALGSTMILLSATLSRETRQSLLRQVGVLNSDDVDIDVPYPRLTIVDNERNIQVHSLPAPPTHKLNLHHLHLPSDDIASWLAPTYEQGGCIAIICNTVDASIKVARTLRSCSDFVPDDIVLFHARTPYAWRKDTESEVLEKFGKNGNRPERMIVVATQIIEQSLDLDFDLMITEIAPIDLLIQRAGRLHRHPNRTRPEHLSEPTLILCTPQFDQDGVPDFGVNGFIYENYILLRTWQLLADRTEILIPDEIDEYMNAVYREIIPDELPEDDPFSNALQTAYDEMTMGNNGRAFRGKMYCIGAPDDEFLIGNKGFELSDDDNHNIATRDISPSIDIVCLSQDESPDYLPAYNESVPTQTEKDRLLQFKISIRKKSLYDRLDKLSTHSGWQRIPQLRYARPVTFHGEIYTIPGTTIKLRLTPFYGLEFIEEDA
jgi:CRISPR-associated endonuclease/helicase Cas3